MYTSISTYLFPNTSYNGQSSVLIDIFRRALQAKLDVYDNVKCLRSLFASPATRQDDILSESTHDHGQFHQS